MPPEPAEPEDVPNLDRYRPGTKKYQVSLAFSGDAAKDMDVLMINLKAASANEVAKRAIALLLSAQGKEILLRDRSGKVETVEV